MLQSEKKHECSKHIRQKGQIYDISWEIMEKNWFCTIIWDSFEFALDIHVSGGIQIDNANNLQIQLNYNLM